MHRMRRLIVIPLLVVLLLSVAGTVQAGSTKGMASSWNGLPMTCDETQVINGNMRKETFHCGYPFPAPATALVLTPDTAATWFSDYDGAFAVNFHIVISPSGNLDGWATY